MRMTTLAILAALLTPGLTAQVEVEKPAKDKIQKKGRNATNKKAAYKLGSVVKADLTLKDIHGKVHDFKSLRGKVVFVHFWDTRCPAIKKTQARMNAIHADYKDKDVVVLGINANQREIGLDPALAKATDVDGAGEAPAPYGKVRKFVERNKVPYPILVDHNNKVTDMFKARTTPHCYVIDQKGVLRYHGALDDDPRGRKGEKASNHVRVAIDALLAGDEYENKSTRPYG